MVVTPRLAVIGYPDSIADVSEEVADADPADVTRAGQSPLRVGSVRADTQVVRDARSFHVQTHVVIEVVEVSPEGTVLDASPDAEVSPAARRGAEDEHPPGHEIGWNLLTAPPGKDTPSAEEHQTGNDERQQNGPAHGRPHESHRFSLHPLEQRERRQDRRRCAG